MHSPASGALQWPAVAHRATVALACGILLSGLGLLGLHVTGSQLYPTRGDSMEPASSSGSLLIARLTAPEDIRASDFIVFQEASQTRRLISHRVVLVVKDGERAFAITQGDNNPVVDPEPVALDRPVARFFLVLPWVGWFLTLTTVWCVLGVIALLGLRVAWPWLALRQWATVLDTRLLGPMNRGGQRARLGSNEHSL